MAARPRIAPGGRPSYLPDMGEEGERAAARAAGEAALLARAAIIIACVALALAIFGLFLPL